MTGWLAWYWAQAGGNIWAMPLEAVITFGAGAALLRPARTLWRRHFGAQADLDDIRRMAAAAHKISADLHERLTGERHPLHPQEEERREPGV